MMNLKGVRVGGYGLLCKQISYLVNGLNPGVSVPVLHCMTVKVRPVVLLDSKDDFRSGCRNVSHQQQFFSELHSPGRSHNTNYINFLFTLIHSHCTRNTFIKYSSESRISE